MVGASGSGLQRDKTKIVHLDEGFDFWASTFGAIGQAADHTFQAALKRVRERLATEIRSLRGAPALVVIKRLNPIIRGWSAYYRAAVASEAFASLDTYVWGLTYKWARRSHRNKSRHWVVARYFGLFNRATEPLGVRRPRERRLPAAVQLDPDRPAPDGVRDGRHPTTPPWPSTGPDGAGEQHSPAPQGGSDLTPA